MPRNILAVFSMDVAAGSYPFGGTHFYPLAPLRTVDEIASNHIGQGQLGYRQFSRPVSYEIDTSVPYESEDPAGINEITFYTKGGAVYGRVRTDIQDGIVSSIKFTKVRGDCRECSIQMTRLPDFPIQRFSKFSIQIGRASQPWFFGRIEQTPRPGHTAGSGVLFEGFGMRKTLERVRKTGTFTAATDVGEVVYQLVLSMRNNNEADFNFNIGKINRTTGTVLVGQIDVSRVTVDRVMDLMATYSLHDWGVDSRGDFFFLPREIGVTRTLFDGYDFSQMKVKEDLASVRNSIVLKRQQPTGSGELGYTIGAQVSDSTSIAKYGVRPQDITVPSMFTDYECEEYGAVLIEELKEPKVNVELNGIPIRTDNDVFGRGKIRIVSDFTEFSEVIHDCESLTDTVIHGTGDMTVSVSTAQIHDGSGAFRILHEQAQGQRFQMPVDVSGALKKLTVWIYASRLGDTYRIGVGNNAWDDLTFDVKIGVVGRFYPVTFDVSSLDRIQLVSIYVVDEPDSVSDSPLIEIYVDSISVTKDGHPDYEVETSKEQYTFSGTKRTIDLDCGPTPARLENYIVNVLKIQKELEAAVDEQ